MRYRMTMQDGLVWYLDYEVGCTPARMTLSDYPDKIPYGEWNFTPFSWQSTNGTVEDLAMKIAKWADFEEWMVAEAVLIEPTQPRVPRYAPDADARHSMHPEIPDKRAKINEEMKIIRMAMRRLDEEMKIIKMAMRRWERLLETP
jgi:hypothetical protein